MQVVAFSRPSFFVSTTMTSMRFLTGPVARSLLQRRLVHVERRIADLGITLPPAPQPKANYNIVCRASGNMLYVSGHLPLMEDGTLLTGRIGENGGESVEHGYKAARQCGLNLISTLKEQLGDLDRVEQVVKVHIEPTPRVATKRCLTSLQVFGIVQSDDDFKSQHLVMDGCSDVLMEVFTKDVGYHARSAIGTSTLPLNMSVEVECIVQVKQE